MGVQHWFISDLHIKDINERSGNTLLRFLIYLNKNPSQHQLFLLGDIFDFWISDGRAFQKHYAYLIEQIQIFLEGGGKVFYFEGNHDFHVDVFWTKKLGVPVFENEAYFKIGEYKVRLEHGDFINPNDKSYLKYRQTVRKAYVEPFGHYLPGIFWKWVGEAVSAKSRKRSSTYAVQNQKQIIELIRTYAQKTHKQKEFDLIITGHMHVVDDFTFQTSEGPARSINLGTWLDRPRALRIEGSKIEMIDLKNLEDLES
jgi:UDP-2,3-diacylglucosamine hydrolase